MKKELHFLNSPFRWQSALQALSALCLLFFYSMTLAFHQDLFSTEKFSGVFKIVEVSPTTALVLGGIVLVCSVFLLLGILVTPALALATLTHGFLVLNSEIAFDAWAGPIFFFLLILLVEKLKESKALSHTLLLISYVFSIAILAGISIHFLIDPQWMSGLGLRNAFLNPFNSRYGSFLLQGHLSIILSYLLLLAFLSPVFTLFTLRYRKWIVILAFLGSLFLLLSFKLGPYPLFLMACLIPIGSLDKPFFSDLKGLPSTRLTAVLLASLVILTFGIPSRFQPINQINKLAQVHPHFFGALSYQRLFYRNNTRSQYCFLGTLDDGQTSELVIAPEARYCTAKAGEFTESPINTFINRVMRRHLQSFSSPEYHKLMNPYVTHFTKVFCEASEDGFTKTLTIALIMKGNDSPMTWENFNFNNALSTPKLESEAKILLQRTCLNASQPSSRDANEWAKIVEDQHLTIYRDIF
jgi:hypothetical protein